MKKENEYNKHLTELSLRLREVRKSKSLTQQAIANVGKVSVQSQKLYEAGKRSPNSDYLNNLNEFGLDACYVLSGIKRNSEYDVNHDLKREILFEVLETIEDFSLNREKPISTKAKVDLTTLFYDTFSKIGKVDQTVILGYLKHVC